MPLEIDKTHKIGRAQPNLCKSNGNVSGSRTTMRPLSGFEWAFFFYFHLYEIANSLFGLCTGTMIAKHGYSIAMELLIFSSVQRPKGSRIHVCVYVC